jgi:PAS domain S-box-containing protein
MNYIDKTKEELIEEMQKLEKKNSELRSANTINGNETEELLDYKQLFDNMFNGFALQKIITDDSGNPIDFKYLAVNKQFGVQTGMNTDNIVGKTILEVLPEVEKEWIEKYGKVALTGEPMRFTQYTEALKRYFDVYVFSPKNEYFAIIFNDVTEYQNLIESVRNTENKYRHLFSNAPDAILVADPDTGIVLNANKSAAKLWNRPIDELIGMHQTQLHPEEAKDAAAGDFKGLKSKKVEEMTPIELPIITSDGKIVPIEVISQKLDYDGKPALLGYFRDLTERIKAESQIRESEEKFRLLAENASDVISMFKEGECVYCSPSVRQILGFEPEELMGNVGILGIHPGDVKIIEKANQEILEHGYLNGVEARYLKKDGSFVWLDTTSRIINFENGGERILLNISRDVNDKKLALMELEENEQLLRETGRLAKVGGWKIFYDLDRIYFSETSVNIFQLDRKEITLKDLASYFKQSHQKLVEDSFKELLESDLQFDLVLQISPNTNDYKWIRIIGKAEPISENTKKHHGTIQDITEQILVQEQLITERERLDVTLKSIGDGVITTDKFGSITLLNKIAEELTGWTNNDAFGKKFLDIFNIINEETGKASKDPVAEVLATNKAVGLENHTKLISKNGDEFIIADSASPIQNSQGEVIGVVLVFRDVTDSKRASDKIKNQNKLLNLANAIFEDSVKDTSMNDLAGKFLDSAMELTSATIGFVGKINENERFDTLGFRGYDPLSHGLTEPELKKILTNVKLKGLRGYVYESKKGFYTNEPDEHPKSKGVPKWHTKIESFLGYPLIDNSKVIGIIGIANKAGGFNDTDLENMRYLSYTFIACYNRKKTELDLIESESRYRTLIEMAPVPMIIHDEDRFLYCNAESLKVLKAKDQEEVIAKTIWDLVPEENHEQVRNRISDLSQKNGTSDLYEEKVIRMNDDVIYIEIRGTKIEYLGKKAFLIAFQDITDKKKFEDTLRESEKKLKEAITSKDKFFDIIAHDLRSPILGFLGLSESISKNFYHISMQEMQEMSNALYRSSFNLNRLLENLLEWSRTQTGKIETNPVPHNIFESVTECYELNSTTADKKQIKIVNEVPKYTMVYADRKMIYTVIRNLVNNALKFTEPGGEVKVSSKKNKKMLEISITDTGIGIPEQHVGKLFKIDDSFTSLGTEKEKGTGLGLILCKEFVKMNGGDIWLETQVGKGSTFTFSLPIMPYDKK